MAHEVEDRAERRSFTVNRNSNVVEMMWIQRIEAGEVLGDVATLDVPETSKRTTVSVVEPSTATYNLHSRQASAPAGLWRSSMGIIHGRSSLTTQDPRGGVAIATDPEAGKPPCRPTPDEAETWDTSAINEILQLAPDR